MEQNKVLFLAEGPLGCGGGWLCSEVEHGKCTVMSWPVLWAPRFLFAARGLGKSPDKSLWPKPVLFMNEVFPSKLLPSGSHPQNVSAVQNTCCQVTNRFPQKQVPISYSHCA